MKRARFMRNIVKILVFNFTVILFSCLHAGSFETSADSISINKNKKEFSLIGNALAVYKLCQKIYNFKADSIIVVFDENSTSFDVPKNIKANGKVKFSTDGISVTSSSCEFKNNVVSFSGNVEISEKNLGVILADKVMYSMETKKIDITSSSRVKLTLKDVKNISDRLKSKK